MEIPACDLSLWRTAEPQRGFVTPGDGAVDLEEISTDCKVGLQIAVNLFRLAGLQTVTDGKKVMLLLSPLVTLLFGGGFQTKLLHGV